MRPRPEAALRIVVTGASGFLGASVLHALRAHAGVRPLGVSRRTRPGLFQVDRYRDAPGGDVLVHLAEESDRARVAQAGAAYEDHVRETLDALLAKGYQRVVYASSAALYGDGEAHPHRVADPVYVTDPYTRVKRGSELAVLQAPGGVIARVSNLYGRGMAVGNVTSTILEQIPGEGPVRVRDASAIRDFLWVDDAAAGLAALATHDGVARPGIFNLGTGVGTSIRALARVALECAGQEEREVVSASAPRHSMLVVDYSETESACGWHPTTDLRQGFVALLGAPHAS